MYDVNSSTYPEGINSHSPSAAFATPARETACTKKPLCGTRVPGARYVNVAGVPRSDLPSRGVTFPFPSRGLSFASLNFAGTIACAFLLRNSVLTCYVLLAANLRVFVAGVNTISTHVFGLFQYV